MGLGEINKPGVPEGQNQGTTWVKKQNRCYSHSQNCVCNAKHCNTKATC